MVSVGDYIIKGVKGEFYACKPDIFMMTYRREIAPTPPSSERRFDYDSLSVVEQPNSDARAVVAGEWMESTIAQHVQRAEHLLITEQEKPLPDNALIALLADSIRMARELVRVATLPQPSSEARAVGLTEDMVSAGEMRYLQMLHPDEQNFVSSPWGRNLVAQIYYAMQRAATLPQSEEKPK